MPKQANKAGQSLIAWDVVNEAIEHALVVDNVPVSVHSLFVSHFLAILEAFEDGFLLLEVGLSEHIVRVFQIRVLENSFCLLDFEENFSRVNIFVLVWMELEHLSFVFFLQGLLTEMLGR